MNKLTDEETNEIVGGVRDKEKIRELVMSIKEKLGLSAELETVDYTRTCQSCGKTWTVKRLKNWESHWAKRPTFDDYNCPDCCKAREKDRRLDMF